ncbi:MAG: nitroreductase family protein [Odoribacter sp.]|nr:nitroreductase family protein [Odoribacter sp.]
MLKNLLIKNRSYRRFYQETRIPREVLEELVGQVRWCPSGRNAQPLRYAVLDAEEECARIFPLLAWAGYLTDWDGPVEGERPAAYVIQLLDTRIVTDCLCDDGIQAQTIMLGVAEKGFGGCIIKAFKNESLREVLALPEYMKILYVLALGKPKEQVVVEEMRGEDYKYWRDAEGVHHVPKRAEKELIFRVGEK